MPTSIPHWLNSYLLATLKDLYLPFTSLNWTGSSEQTFTSVASSIDQGDNELTRPGRTQVLAAPFKAISIEISSYKY